MQNYWWILAIALSLLTSAYVYVNQFVKIKGSLLMVYRGLGTAAVLLPFVFALPRFITGLFMPYVRHRDWSFLWAITGF